MPGAGGKPQQYGRDGGGHNVRDGYPYQSPPFVGQWDKRGGYRPFVPGGMGCVSHSCLIPSSVFISSHNFLRSINDLFVILLACSLVLLCIFSLLCLLLHYLDCVMSKSTVQCIKYDCTWISYIAEYTDSSKRHCFT